MSEHRPPVPLSVSFEFFPPSDAQMERRCGVGRSGWRRCAPRFVSVTYGADGSTRERTHHVVTRIQQRDDAHRRAAPDLRRRDARARSSTSRAATGARASATSSRCAAIRRRAAAATRRIRTASPMPPTWCAG